MIRRLTDWLFALDPSGAGMSAPQWARMSRWQRRRFRAGSRLRTWERKVHRTVMGARATRWLAARTGRHIAHGVGDSHARVFEVIHRSRLLDRTWFRVRWLPAATCYGLENTDSSTGAGPALQAELAGIEDGSVVVFSLGEVDVGYLCWSMAERRNVSPRKVLEASLERYERFVQTHAKGLRVVVMAVPQPVIEHLPTGGLKERRDIDVPIEERREMTVWFNQQLAAMADRNGWRLFNTRGMATDPDTGAVRDELVLPWGDHHYEWERHAELVADELQRLGIQ